MEDAERDKSGGAESSGFGVGHQSAPRLIASLFVAAIIIIAVFILQPRLLSNRPTLHPGKLPTPHPPVYPFLGEARASGDGIQMTPLRVVYTRGTGINVANTGDIYAVVTLRIVNNRNSDYAFIPNTSCALQVNCNVYVRDTQGEKNPPVGYDPLNTGLRPVVLQPRGEQEGSYTFEVPERDARAGTLQLLWYPNPVAEANLLIHWWLRERGHA